MGRRSTHRNGVHDTTVREAPSGQRADAESSPTILQNAFAAQRFRGGRLRACYGAAHRRRSPPEPGMDARRPERPVRPARLERSCHDRPERRIPLAIGLVVGAFRATVARFDLTPIGDHRAPSWIAPPIGERLVHLSREACRQRTRCCQPSRQDAGPRRALVPPCSSVVLRRGRGPRPLRRCWPRGRSRSRRPYALDCRSPCFEHAAARRDICARVGAAVRSQLWHPAVRLSGALGCSTHRDAVVVGARRRCPARQARSRSGRRSR